MDKLTDPTEQLKEVLKRIVDRMHPDQIYLFGSYGRGSHVPGQSDIDLLIIVPESELPRHVREAHFYDALWGLTTPVDLVVLTKEEFDRSRRVKTSLAATAVHQGKLVYG
jgi:predicted nucleotidyltransferase